MFPKRIEGGPVKRSTMYYLCGAGACVDWGGFIGTAMAGKSDTLTQYRNIYNKSKSVEYFF